MAPAPATTPIVVAVDGPSGSGKSSASRRVAASFGWDYVDTGAMYRAVTWWMLEHGVDVDDPESIALHADSPLIDVVADPGAPGIFVDGTDVSMEIRTARVSDAVSRVSAVPRVRSRLVELQRAAVATALDQGRGIVMEGRDIGTVVVPEAPVKVFLTADAAARAHRRALEDAERGTLAATTGDAVRATEESLRARDERDSTREVSPLAAAPDAESIDATDLDLDQVVARILGLVAARGHSVAP